MVKTREESAKGTIGLPRAEEENGLFRSHRYAVAVMSGSEVERVDGGIEGRLFAVREESQIGFWRLVLGLPAGDYWAQATGAERDRLYVPARPVT